MVSLTESASVDRSQNRDLWVLRTLLFTWVVPRVPVEKFIELCPSLYVCSFPVMAIVAGREYNSDAVRVMLQGGLVSGCTTQAGSDLCFPGVHDPWAFPSAASLGPQLGWCLQGCGYYVFLMGASYGVLGYPFLELAQSLGVPLTLVFCLFSKCVYKPC